MLACALGALMMQQALAQSVDLWTAVIKAAGVKAE